MKLTTNEIKFLEFVYKELQPHLEEGFSVLMVEDVAIACEISISVAKGILGSLCKKDILETMALDCGDRKVRDFIFFIRQAEMNSSLSFTQWLQANGKQGKNS